MQVILKFPTRIGVFYIARSTDGRYHSIFDNERLGICRSIAHTTGNLTNDATSSVLHPETIELIDTPVLGLPDNADEWVRA